MRNSGYILVLLASFLLISCKGPEGPAGLTGPAGGDGKDGTDGITELTVFTIDFLISEAEQQGNYLFYSFDTSLIDEDVINNGTVLAHWDNGGYYMSLPYTECADGEDNGEVDGCLELTYWYRLNEITIVLSNTSESFPWNQNARTTIKCTIFHGEIDQ